MQNNATNVSQWAAAQVINQYHSENAADRKVDLKRVSDVTVLVTVFSFAFNFSLWIIRHLHKSVSASRFSTYFFFFFQTTPVSNEMVARKQEYHAHNKMNYYPMRRTGYHRYLSSHQNPDPVRAFGRISVDDLISKWWHITHLISSTYLTTCPHSCNFGMNENSGRQYNDWHRSSSQKKNL